MPTKQFFLRLGGLISIALLPLILLGVEFVGTQVHSRDVYIASTRTGLVLNPTTKPIVVGAPNLCHAEVYDANSGQHIPHASMSWMCTILKDGRTGTLWYGKGRISGEVNYDLKFD